MQDEATGGSTTLAPEGALASFARLYEEWYPKVYRYVSYRIGQADAEDATSEVFLGAWRSFDALEGAFAPWLFRIARNVTAGGLRKRYRRPQTVPLAAAEDRPASSGDPETLGIGSVAYAVLHRALERLPEEQRQVILLKFVAGLSNREVGDALGKSENAVNTQQFRALRALRRALVKEGYDAA